MVDSHGMQVLLLVMLVGLFLENIYIYQSSQYAGGDATACPSPCAQCPACVCNCPAAAARERTAAAECPDCPECPENTEEHAACPACPACPERDAKCPELKPVPQGSACRNNAENGSDFSVIYLMQSYRKTGKTYDSPSEVLLTANTFSKETMASKQFSGGAYPTDKANIHYYLQHYKELFEPYKLKDINILEIGVKLGGSIALWREYFTADSHIYGLDINCEVPTFNADPNIKVIIADSSKDVTREYMQGVQYDIIVRPLSTRAR
eukprot:TRINITY_DN3359_c0_g1_i1.p1 TRINITY_DN3359_c0_g1~~TRINITY_DN3359_c0_g1_i1.p1  ORF type:complete len:283 (-),score=76.50 TRINITY_DN3359_c0_g1_i1:394-1191(-)